MSKSAAWRTLELRRMNRTDEAKHVQGIMDALEVWVAMPRAHLMPFSGIHSAANDLIGRLIHIHEALSFQIRMLTDKMDAEETGAEELP